MAFRRFSDEQLERCEEWFGLVETPDDWTSLGPIGEGESKSIRVENVSGLIGVAKPGVPKNDGVCRAAHERIAFKLAHVLELPVPPVVLWDRGEEHADNRYLSISVWAFAQSMKWNEAQHAGIIDDTTKASAAPVVSAMRVFHTWIADTDRKSDHTQIDVDSPKGNIGIAFIDHAFSMSKVWQQDNAPVVESSKYMPVNEVPEVLAQVVDQIAALPDERVQEIVNRITAPYLPAMERGYILSNLISRKKRLRTILAIP